MGLQAHYRTPWNFTWEALGHQQERLSRWRSNLRRLSQQSEAVPAAPELVDDLRAALVAGLKDDFNTAAALAVIEDALKRANTTASEAERRALVEFVFDADRVLGLRLRVAATSAEELSDEEARLLRERDTARAARDWRRADALRVELARRGIRVHDEKQSTRWERIPATTAKR